MKTNVYSGGRMSATKTFQKKFWGEDIYSGGRMTVTDSV